MRDPQPERDIDPELCESLGEARHGPQIGGAIRMHHQPFAGEVAEGRERRGETRRHRLGLRERGVELELDAHRGLAGELRRPLLD